MDGWEAWNVPRRAAELAVGDGAKTRRPLTVGDRLQTRRQARLLGQGVPRGSGLLGGVP